MTGLRRLYSQPVHQTMICLPPAWSDWLKQEAKKRGSSKSKLIRQAVLATFPQIAEIPNGK